LETRPEYVLCHTQTVTIDTDGNELGNDIVRSSGAAEDLGKERAITYAPWLRFRDVLLGNTAIMDQWGVIRTDALRDIELRRHYVGYEKVQLANLSLLGRFAEIPERLFSYRVHSKSFSSQTSPQTLQDWSGSNQKMKHYPHFQYLRGYVLGINRSRLPIREKLLCCLALGRYIFQFHKWRRVAQSMIFGSNFGDGNAEILNQNTVTTITRAQQNGHINNG
jgi:hypothetical protein